MLKWLYVANDASMSATQRLRLKIHIPGIHLGMLTAVKGLCEMTQGQNNGTVLRSICFRQTH
jgi:hypothetical protein